MENIEETEDTVDNFSRVNYLDLIKKAFRNSTKSFKVKADLFLKNEMNRLVEQLQSGKTLVTYKAEIPRWTNEEYAYISRYIINEVKKQGLCCNFTCDSFGQTIMQIYGWQQIVDKEDAEAALAEANLPKYDVKVV